MYEKAIYFKPNTDTNPIQLEPFVNVNVTEFPEKWTLLMWVKMMAISSDRVYLMYSGGRQKGPSAFIENANLVFESGNNTLKAPVEKLKPLGKFHNRNSASR